MFDRHIACIAVMLALLIGIGLGAGNAAAQPSAAPNGTISPIGDAPLIGRALTSEEEAARLGEIRGAMAAIRLASYIAVAIAVASGIWLFVYRRRRTLRHSKTAGALCAVLVAWVLFATLSAWLTTPQAASCASITIDPAAQTTDFEDVCRAARESAANSFGLASLYRALLVPEGGGQVTPIGAAVLKFLAYFGVLAVALVLFLALRPPAERRWVRM